MFLQIEPYSDIPIYTQISQQIIEGIANKDIIPGDSLPSVRSLAADLGVNMHTVNKSYHQLEKKGLITIIPKTGAVVNVTREEEEEGGVKVERLDYMEKMLRPVVAEGIVYGLGLSEFEMVIKKLMKTLQ
jgi:GntR family transcriptional regulator